MLKLEKRNFVLELEKIFKASNSIVIVHYHGLTVLQITNLRKTLRENNASLKIVKNTLAKVAASNIGLIYGTHFFSGPVAMAYSQDIVESAKSIIDFIKDNNELKVVGAIVNDQVLNANEVGELAILPSLTQLRQKIVINLQNTAINLARALQNPAQSLQGFFNFIQNKNN